MTRQARFDISGLPSVSTAVPPSIRLQRSSPQCSIISKCNRVRSMRVNIPRSVVNERQGIAPTLDQSFLRQAMP